MFSVTNQIRYANISVVISVMNREEDLKFAVKSVLNQTTPPLELIIVDDGSVVPVSSDICTNTKGVDIRLLRNEINIGGAKSINIGIQASKCEIVAILDSDDYFASTYLERVATAWGAVGHDVVCIAVGFWWCTNELKPYRTQIVTRAVDYLSLLRDGNFVGGSSVLSVRRDVSLAIGGYPHVRGSHDWGFLLRLARVGTISTLPEPLLFYRSPSANVTPTETKRYRRQIIALVAIMRQQPNNYRAEARRHIHLIVCMQLAQNDRLGLGNRCIRGYISRYGLDRSILRVILIALCGGRQYELVLKNLAYMRAMFNKVPQID